MNVTALNPALKQSASDEVARCAFNGAFWDLGFKWQWDGETYRALCSIRDEKERIRTYIRDHQSHLLQAYDPEFLVNLIHEKKAHRHDAILAAHASGTPVNLSCNGVKGNV